MRSIKDLSNAEADAYLIDMTEIQCSVANEIVSLADKYGLDRDEAMKHFSVVMAVMAESVSFKEFKISEEVKHANRS